MNTPEYNEDAVRAIVESDPVRAIRLVFMSIGFDDKPLENQAPYTISWCLNSKDYNIVFNC